MTPLDLLEVAHAYAARSKDPSTKLAALIIDDNMVVRSSGWNGFARGVADTPERLNDRATKLSLVCHAEANAIANAARIGVSTEGCVLLVTQLHPCADCSKLIVQAGIKKVYAPLPQDIDSRWATSFETAALIFNEAKVEVEFY